MFHCNVILIMIIIILIKRTTHQANLNYTKDVSEQFGSFIISKIQVLNTVLVNVKALRCLHLLRSSVHEEIIVTDRKLFETPEVESALY